MIYNTHTANVCRDLQGLYGEIGVWGFQISGDCMYTRNPCNFWSKSKKIYSLLRFFKFPYNFCGDFSRTCNPRDNYMHFTGYVLWHVDPPHILWGKNLQCRSEYFLKQNNIYSVDIIGSGPHCFFHVKATRSHRCSFVWIT